MSLYPVTGEVSLERLVKIASARFINCDVSVFPYVLNNCRDTLRLCKYPINCHTLPTNCSIFGWFYSETIITVEFVPADFLFPSFLLYLLIAVHLCIPLCVYISYGPMDICFILWNIIHHSHDRVSGSDDPRCVHLKRFQLVLCLLGMSPSFFWALFKFPTIIRVPRLTLYFSCHRLESAISPRIPDSFYWRRYLGSKIWVLGAYTCSSPLLNRHNASSPALIPDCQLSITCSRPKDQGDREILCFWYPEEDATWWAQSIVATTVALSVLSPRWFIYPCPVLPTFHS